ncbi:class I SAM-dependent methyltransferase [Pseudomonas jinjuensis]|uniref:Methyltransferase domain-containing protein n=1 Tax=Pseudomonas jinjuensis TaxID=198616 RepID=A0A1H0K6S3_9PSED|nr:class I SAM-dependent methyltransferase [Pseudomonas jinjuensis]SDO51567.1 Methyltransferase domain-containing protein [Pseudomonas jinjuensis]
MRISGGLKEDGIVVGNAYDKYNSKNPIVRKIMAGFDNSLSELVAKAQPTSIHEVGCGEGFWVMRWREQGLNARGSDFSTQAIDIARANATERNLPSSVFEARSIYDIETGRDSADLVVCCEVMEHLEHPEQGLEALQRVVGRHLILSVPREPIWCALNLVRGKYIADFGNTPGHIQHWSQKGFISLVSRYFDVLEVRSPLPWTMLLCKPR